MKSYVILIFTIIVMCNSECITICDNIHFNYTIKICNLNTKLINKYNMCYDIFLKIKENNIYSLSNTTINHNNSTTINNTQFILSNHSIIPLTENFTSPSSSKNFTSPSSSMNFTNNMYDYDDFTSPSSSNKFTSPSSREWSLTSNGFSAPSSNNKFTSPSSNDIFTSPSSNDIFISPSSSKYNDNSIYLVIIILTSIITFLIIIKYKMRKGKISFKIKPFIDPKDVKIKIISNKEGKEYKETKLKLKDDKNRPKDYIIEQLNNKNKLIKQNQNVKINIPNDNLIEHNENKITPYQVPRKYKIPHLPNEDDELIDLKKLPPLPIRSRTLINSNNNVITPPPRPRRVNELINEINKVIKPPPRPPRLHELINSNNDIIKPPARPQRLHEINNSNNDITKPPQIPLRSHELIDQNNDITKPPPRPLRLHEIINSNNDITKLPSIPPQSHELINQNNDITKSPRLIQELIDQNDDCNHINNKIILKSI